MRLVYLGTPAFAVPTLERVVEAGHHVLAVLTQPDRPKGRGRELAASPVKQAALELGLPVYQPERVRRPEALEYLAALHADAMVVVGYGQIIPQSIIDLAPYGIINVHASLLPKYRGAAPIQWAIANGETVTGVTTMQLDAGLDTGDMLLKAEMPIRAEDTAVTLSPRLSELGAALLIETLRGLVRGEITATPQSHQDATHAPILKKEDGVIDFRRTAVEIWNRLRGFQPWPGAFTTFRARQFTIHSARPAIGVNLAPALLAAHGDTLYVGAGANTALELLEVQPEGKRRMSAGDFSNGYRPQPGEKLGA